MRKAERLGRCWSKSLDNRDTREPTEPVATEGHCSRSIGLHRLFKSMAEFAEPGYSQGNGKYLSSQVSHGKPWPCMHSGERALVFFQRALPFTCPAGLIGQRALLEIGQEKNTVHLTTYCAACWDLGVWDFEICSQFCVLLSHATGLQRCLLSKFFITITSYAHLQILITLERAQPQPRRRDDEMTKASGSSTGLHLLQLRQRLRLHA